MPCASGEQAHACLVPDSHLVSWFTGISGWSLTTLCIPSLKGPLEHSHCNEVADSSAPIHDFTLVIKTWCTTPHISLSNLSPLFLNFCQHDYLYLTKAKKHLSPTFLQIFISINHVPPQFSFPQEQTLLKPILNLPVLPILYLWYCSTMWKMHIMQHTLHWL